MQNLLKCCRVQLPRQNIFHSTIALHAFSDAGNTAYGTAMYVVDPTGSRLVMAKAKVAPIMSLLIPKLELTAVSLAARLLHYIEEAFHKLITISEITVWSDSQISLYWVNSNKKLPVYVTNRVD